MKKNRVGIVGQQSAILPIVALLALLNFPTGCASLRTPPPYSEHPEGAAEALRGIEERQNGLEIFSAMARIRIEDKKGGRSIRELITIGGEDRLRLESLDILGQPYLIIVKNGEEIEIYNAKERTLEREVDTPGVVYKLTGLTLSVDSISRIITQRFISKGDRILNFRPGEAGESSLLSVGKGNGESIDILLGGESLPASTVYTDREKNITEKVYYSNYEKIQPKIYYPKNIRVELPLNGVSLNIKLSDIEINKAIDESFFLLEVPQNTQPLI